MRVDEEGYLSLELPWEDHAAEHQAFWEWLGSACEHQNMNAASERVSNWSGVRAFQTALREVGEGHFPVLLAEIPDANGGLMKPAACAAGLRELARFTELVRSTRSTFLVDDETGTELYRYIPQYHGVFQLSREHGDVGVDPEGLFVARHAEDGVGEIVFRAMRAEQIVIARNDLGDAELVRLRCLDSGQESPPIASITGRQIPWPDGRMEDDGGRCRFACPQRLGVIRRGLTVADFDFILGALRRLFEASSVTGNPVRWS
ncbi:hypothetical protein A7982_13335 [Minicystis rosea]|nr:hypothetical protein A7982_13335 [Minicystis rosea]